MNVQELYIEVGGVMKPCEVWMCGECRTLHGGKTQPNGEQRAKDCCAPPMCRDCAKELPDRYRTQCKDCSKLDDMAREDERFEKAKKIPADSYLEPVMTVDERWFESVDELIDAFNDDEEPLPKYCYGSRTQKAHYDADWIAEHISSNAHEDYYDAMVDLDELQKYLDEWCAKQPDWWEADMKTAVILDAV